MAEYVDFSMLNLEGQEVNSAYCMPKLSSLNIGRMERHQRIAHAIAASGKRKGEVAQACGVAPSSVTQWINGDSKSLKPENLFALAKATGFNPAWLAIGEGPEKFEPGNVEPAKTDRQISYPVISMVSAGEWEEAIETYPVGLAAEYIATDYQGSGMCFWARIKGDSMTAPYGDSFPDGSYVLIDTGLAATPGALVVAKRAQDGEATFKKLVEDAGRQYLRPLNPAFEMLPIDEETRIIGVAKEMKRRL